jgi:hypothetical protein
VKFPALVSRIIVLLTLLPRVKAPFSRPKRSLSNKSDGNGCAVQLHEYIRFAGAEIVHSARNQLFSSARLTIDEDRGIGRCHRFDLSQDALEDLAAPDDVLKKKLVANLGFQLSKFLTC